MLPLTASRIGSGAGGFGGAAFAGGAGAMSAAFEAGADAESADFG